jgi:hypothetical protein
MLFVTNSTSVNKTEVMHEITILVIVKFSLAYQLVMDLVTHACFIKFSFAPEVSYVHGSSIRVGKVGRRFMFLLCDSKFD